MVLKEEKGAGTVQICAMVENDGSTSTLQDVVVPVSGTRPTVADSNLTRNGVLSVVPASSGYSAKESETTEDEGAGRRKPSAESDAACGQKAQSRWLKTAPIVFSMIRPSSSFVSARRKSTATVNFNKQSSAQLDGRLRMLREKAEAHQTKLTHSVRTLRLMSRLDSLKQVREQRKQEAVGEHNVRPNTKWGSLRSTISVVSQVNARIRRLGTREKHQVRVHDSNCAETTTLGSTSLAAQRMRVHDNSCAETLTLGSTSLAQRLAAMEMARRAEHAREMRELEEILQAQRALFKTEPKGTQTLQPQR